MTKEQCYPCKHLGTMNTRIGKKDCCYLLYPPRALNDVECEQTRMGTGCIIVDPKPKRYERISNHRKGR